MRSTKRMQMPTRSFRSNCIKPTCGSFEQSKRPSFESESELLEPARPAEIQSPGPA